MEKKSDLITQIGVKTISKTAIVVWTLTAAILIGGAWGAAYVMKKSGPKNAVTFSNFDFSDQIKILNQEREIFPPSRDELLAAFKIEAVKLPITVSQIIVKTDNLAFTSSNTLQPKLDFFNSGAIANVGLYKMGYDDTLGQTSFKLLSASQFKIKAVSTAVQKATAIVAFNNLNLEVAKGEPVILWLKGDFQDISFSGQISFKIDANDVETKGQVKVQSTVASPKLKFHGLDEAPSLSVIYPAAGQSYRAGDKIAIQWSGKNLSSASPVNIYLLQESSVEGMKIYDLSRIVELNAGNNGKYSWSVPNDIEPADNYVIQVGCGFGDNIPANCFPSRSGMFSIKK